MNKEYFEDDIFNIPNINLEKIPVPFTFGQLLVNNNVPYNFITELYQEQEWDNLDYENAVNLLKESNTYRKIELYDSFKSDYDNNQQLFENIFDNAIIYKKNFDIKKKILDFISEFKNDLLTQFDNNLISYLLDYTVYDIDSYLYTLIIGDVHKFKSLNLIIKNKIKDTELYSFYSEKVILLFNNITNLYYQLNLIRNTQTQDQNLLDYSPAPETNYMNLYNDSVNISITPISYDSIDYKSYDPPSFTPEANIPIPIKYTYAPLDFNSTIAPSPASAPASAPAPAPEQSEVDMLLNYIKNDSDIHRHYFFDKEDSHQHSHTSSDLNLNQDEVELPEKPIYKFHIHDNKSHVHTHNDYHYHGDLKHKHVHSHIHSHDES